MSYPIIPPQVWQQYEYGGEYVLHVDLVVEEGETTADAIQAVLSQTTHPDMRRAIEPGHIRKVHLKMTFAEHDLVVSELAWARKAEGA